MVGFSTLRDTFISLSLGDCSNSIDLSQVTSLFQPLCLLTWVAGHAANCTLVIGLLVVSLHAHLANQSEASISVLLHPAHSQGALAYSSLFTLVRQFTHCTRNSICHTRNRILHLRI